ncbi:MAG: FAD-dependent oxidoreductase [Oscillospiraceae bacterium]|nr:FAD-dependent oxidoreductase [Oscillospiraceae bacterium]
MAYENLFKPLQVKTMNLRNRIMMTPMGTNLANPDGSISDEHKNYYKLRAQGGTGLIVVENVCVAFPMGSNGTSQLRLDHDSFIPHMYELTEKVHSWGAKISVQVNHAGSAANPARIGAQPVSASEIPCKTGGIVPRAMTTQEVYDLVIKYAEACKRAQMAGFDAVELHAGHSYLISQFISPVTNHRTDEFGGNAEKRAHFLKLILEETRKRVGPSFPIMVRISADEFVSGGNTLEKTLEWLPYVDENIDLYNVSAGLNDSIELMIDKGYLPDGWKRYLSKAIKEKTGKPVIISGNIRDPRIAEEIIADGDADIVAMGRTLIADPEWPNKVKEGRENEIRKCISCCIGCVGNRMVHNRPIRCTVNPAVTTGEVYKKKKILKPCKAVVIGAGTAGLETACTLAEVGCSVTLIEQNDHLGGRAAFVSNLPEKYRMKDLVAYFVNRINGLPNIKVMLNTEATKELVTDEKPDLIVCATGSKILLPPISGLSENLAKGNIFTADDVIKLISGGSCSEDMKGKKTIIIGGGATGLDLVEYFANREADVTVVEMTEVLGNGMDLVSKVSITNLMRKKHVKQMINTKLLEVKEHSFITDGGELAFDYGCICLGLESYNPLKEDMSKIAYTVSVGDAKLSPRQIIDGVMEGRQIINSLEALGFID